MHVIKSKSNKTGVTHLGHPEKSRAIKVVGNSYDVSAHEPSKRAGSTFNCPLRYLLVVI